MAGCSYQRGRTLDLASHAFTFRSCPSRSRCLSPGLSLPRAAVTRSLVSDASDSQPLSHGTSSTSPATSSSSPSLANIRDSNGYIARYRTFSPSRQALVGHWQPKTTQARSVTSPEPGSSRDASHASSSRPPQHTFNTSDNGNASVESGSESESGSSWAFGGGAKSQGGPAIANAEGADRDQIPGKTTPLIVMGNAGKGAVANYGKRRKESIPYTSGVTSPAEAAQAQAYQHRYSPSTRSEQLLPQHVYFSSSFNASSFVAPGVQPPLRGTTTAGAGQGYADSSIVRKKTALIMPGQGSQYVAMSRDLYKAFRSARKVWHEAEEALMLTPNQHLHHPPSDEKAASIEQRAAFEAELAKSGHLDVKRGLSACGTAVARGRRGWLRDLVFSGDQLELTRAENAQPAILTCTLAFLQVLRKEFAVDLIHDHVEWSAGHGSGVYAALVGSGAVSLSDAVRLLRHRGLIASHYTANNPVLFPPGCERPESVYETWAFANAGSGKGAELVSSGGGTDSSALAFAGNHTDGKIARVESMLQGDSDEAAPMRPRPRPRRGWKRTQMSGVVVKPGKLQAVLREVEKVAQDIRSGRVSGVAPDEVVEVANVNSQVQIVLSGSRVGVSYACDRLRSKMLGARAVNLPVSGAYHTSLMQSASEALKPAVAHLPLRDPEGFGLVSSMNGSVLSDAAGIRGDLSGALARPVQWLSSVETLLAQGVERFVCLGPGRACAHLLSKELAHRDRVKAAAGGVPEESGYEVWSLATVEDVMQLGEALSSITTSVPPPDISKEMDRLVAD